MGRRALPAALVVAATYADGRGAHGLAFDALLAAIPFAAVAALVAFGAYLEHPEEIWEALQAVLAGLAVALLVLACAARSPATHVQPVPPLGRSALVACLFVLGIQLCAAAGQLLRRLALARVAKP